jgi:hypothetical protein
VIWHTFKKFDAFGVQTTLQGLAFILQQFLLLI